MTDITAGAVGSKAAPALAAGVRLREIDMLRGLVIVIMALDHARDFFHESAYAYSPLDPDHTTPFLYLTRWVTHFCAPTFVLLAGVSAWLQGEKGKDTPTLSRFLLTRGLWLVVLELTFVNLAWTFAIPGMPFLQVIWAIGWSMMALAALVWLPRKFVLAIGVAIILLHNLLDPVQPQALGSFALLWQFLHVPGPIFIGGQPVGLLAYPVLPWVGVMAFGYGLGPVFAAPARERDRTLMLLGAGMIAAFLVLRWINLYGDPQPWLRYGNVGGTLMRFFDVQKYPPSLLYVCATLGAVFLAFPLIARLRGAVGKFFWAFGAVPLFAYVLHIFLLHAMAMTALAARGGDPSLMSNQILKSFLHPEWYAPYSAPLWVAYLAWLSALAILYPLCLWWAGVKSRRRDWWLSYL